ncbi:MAG: transporter substrate-binding domain-containing protein [Erysipelotrichaceae bacterium]|nr:transporter substrate-binding domain-containing protein [Erysipelotrichaceae bacterium]
MKALKILLISLLAMTVLTGCSQKEENNEPADQLAEIQAKGVLVVALEGAYAPWNYHDENDNLIGYDVEVATMIAEKLGVTVQFEECLWDSIFPGIDSKRYDTAIASVSVTEERSEKYNFSNAYAYNKTVVIVQQSNTDITGMEDLAGKKTANTLASTYAQLAEAYGASPDGVDDLEQTIEVLKAGRVDATLNAEVTYFDYLKAHGDAPIKIGCYAPEVELVAIPVRKEGSENLLAAINKALEELAAEGKLTEVSLKYFGVDISHN